VAALATAITAGVAGFAFGPLVRSRVAGEAARRRLEVKVGSVSPAWFGAHLRDVDVRPRGVQGVDARVDDVEVGLGLGLRPDRVRVRGVHVRLTGTPDSLQDSWRTWRREGPSPPAAGKQPVIPVSVEGLSVVWQDEDRPLPCLEIRGGRLERDQEGVRASIEEARTCWGPATVTASGVMVGLDPAGELTRARSASVGVEWTSGPSSSARSDSGKEVETDDARDQPAAAAPPAGKALSSAAPGAAAPMIFLPDLRSARAAVVAVAAVLSRRITGDADVGVDALTWRLDRAGDGGVLSIGPGPLSVARTASSFEIEFTTGPATTNTALSVRATLPTDAGDTTLAIDGGPVSLAVLGVTEGAAGFVDVAHATVTGRARAVLAGDATAVTFDGDWAARGLSIENARLASDPVRGIDFHVRARGALTAPADLRLDDLDVTLGAVHLTASGVLDQQPDHVAAAFRFEVPSAGCQSLLESVPTALLPVLQGTTMAGTFGARGRFAFDTRALADLELGYDTDDRCRVVEIPPPLARERFKGPFSHRIYLPDGTVGSRTTGPGTSAWTALDQISPYVLVAVLTTEDGAFPHHHGYNHASIRASIIANLKARRFVRGASTITMQLAKNLFLSRDKTLARKVQEVVLTDYLEQAFSKDELMELYLNVIEFGPAVYGVAAAADHYFGRTPAELNLAESLFLSSLLPAPKRYGAMWGAGEVSDAWMRTLHTLMRVAHRVGLITDAELAEGMTEPVIFWRGGERPQPRPPVHARNPLGADVEDAGQALPPDEGSDSP